MNLQKARGLLARHPGVFARKALGKLARRLPGALAPRERRFRGVRFQVPRGDNPRLREMRWGLYEPETVLLMERYLRPGDVFIDVGANLGYLSAVGAGLVGTTGEVHAFEPVPVYHERLASLSHLNPTHRIVARNLALGEREGTATLSVAAGENIGWNTMVPGFMRPEDAAETIRVPVERLDSYLEGEGLREVALIKIDTEGFELPVLLGLGDFLGGGARPPILCEVAPAAYSHLRREVEDLFEYMASFSYRARDPVGDPHALRPQEIRLTTNVLFEARKG